MKILLYSANFAPEPTGIGKYSGEMAAWLADRGHQVRVVAAMPYYPRWEIDERYRDSFFCRETWKGVDVRRAFLWVPKGPGGFKRTVHLLSFAITSLPLMLAQIFWRPNLVISVAPALVCAPTALLVARLSGAPAWLHVQDFEVDIAFRMNLLRGEMLQRVVKRMEMWLMRRFDTVSSISSRMIQRLFLKGVDPERVRYLPNWVDLSRFKPSSAKTEFRDQQGITRDSILVLFSGTLGKKQGLEMIPQAAALLAHRTDIKFVICGEGVMKPFLEAKAAELPNLVVRPLQPLAMLGDMLCSADVHLLPQSPGAEDLVLPSKLSGMLASGRPVIATCGASTEIADAVSGCGLVVEPENSAALAQAIERLADDAPLRVRLGRAARIFAEANFERENVLSTVFSVLEASGDNGVRLPEDIVA